MYADPTGHFPVTLGIILVGAAIGAIIGAISNAATQYVMTGTVNGKSVAVAALTGMVSGAIAASPLGLGWQILFGGIVGGLSYAGDAHVNGEVIELDEAIFSIAMGAISGFIGIVSIFDTNRIYNSAL